MVRRVLVRPPPRRAEGGRVSRRAAKATRVRSRPRAASAPKVPRQEVKRSIWAPKSGARIGARPDIRVIEARKRIIATPSKRSRATARPMTSPAAPAAPWTKRAAISTVRSGAITQTMLARV